MHLLGVGGKVRDEEAEVGCERDPRRAAGRAPGRHQGRGKGAGGSLPELAEFADGLMPSLPPPPGGPGWYRRSLASPHPPSVLWEGEEPQKPSLLSSPLPPPTPGRAATICGYSFTRQKKKKVCRMSHTEKKKIQNRAKKTCEWAWRMGLLKLRRSRGSPSHSASLRERSRARPARPPAPWTSEQVGARRPRPRPPPPPRSREIRFRPSPGSPSRSRAGEPGAAPRQRRSGRGRHSWAPSRAARQGRGIPGFRSEGPGGGPGRGREPQRPADLGRRPPGAPARRGPADPNRQSPAQKSESPRRERGCGRETRHAGRWGPGEEEGGGREGGRQRGARGRAGGRRGEADTSGRAALPPRPGGRGGRKGRRERGERRRRAERSLAGPGRAAGGTRGFLAARGAAGAHHAARGRGAGGR